MAIAMGIGRSFGRSIPIGIYGGIAHRQAGQMLRSEIVPKSQSYYDEVIGSVIELKVSCIRQAASRHNRPSKFGASVFDFHYFAYDLQKSKKSITLRISNSDNNRIRQLVNLNNMVEGNFVQNPKSNGIFGNVPESQTHSDPFAASKRLKKVSTVCQVFLWLSIILAVIGGFVYLSGDGYFRSTVASGCFIYGIGGAIFWYVVSAIFLGLSVMTKASEQYLSKERKGIDNASSQKQQVKPQVHQTFDSVHRPDGTYFGGIRLEEEPDDK